MENAIDVGKNVYLLVTSLKQVDKGMIVHQLLFRNGQDGESGFLVDPNNPDDIAHRLEQLLKNDELRRSMGAKGREIALDRFHPAKVAARTREVYLRAIQDVEQKSATQL